MTSLDPNSSAKSVHVPEKHASLTTRTRTSFGTIDEGWAHPFLRETLSGNSSLKRLPDMNLQSLVFNCSIMYTSYSTRLMVSLCQISRWFVWSVGFSYVMGGNSLWIMTCNIFPWWCLSVEWQSKRQEDVILDLQNKISKCTWMCSII